MAESVWDYPRPPRMEASPKRIQIIFNGETIADSKSTFRILETSHPPVYYIPPKEFRTEYLSRATRMSYCEWKGQASYYDLTVKDRKEQAVVWYYPSPPQSYAMVKDYLAVYPSRMDRCLVDGEEVVAQEGDFYGGWITSEIKGPFKGGAGTMGW